MIFELISGMTIAAGVFAALLWSLYQSVMKRGPLQYAHMAAATLTILGMASISAGSSFFAQILGILLLTAAATATILEVRWNRVLPALQIIFSIVLILGLPFVSA